MHRLSSCRPRRERGFVGRRAPCAGAEPSRAWQAVANSPGGLSFERARQSMPRLQRVTFDHADRNGDGVIEGSEFPVFQSLTRPQSRNN